MKLTIVKSNVMWFRPKLSVTEQSPAVTVDGVLKPVSTLKYLGMVFDDRLQWHSHISYVSKVSY